MPTFIFDKLVRDKIPQRLIDHQVTIDCIQIEGQKLLEALKKKIVEEALETSHSSSLEGFKQEIADVLDAVEAACQHFNITSDEIAQLRDQKQEENGAYKKGFYMYSVYMDEQDPILKPWIAKLRQEPDRYREMPNGYVKPHII
jgi:predicted house-cleaning noncanonical NTP pyrophosphatase (MazG superfamily)